MFDYIIFHLYSQVLNYNGNYSCFLNIFLLFDELTADVESWMGQLTGSFLSSLDRFLFLFFTSLHLRFENIELCSINSNLYVRSSNAKHPRQGGWSSFDGMGGGWNALEGNLRNGCHALE